MSDQDIAIKVDSVSKAFKLPHEKHSTIKSLFINVFRGKRTFERQHVLSDISFDIKKGEFFGIVGRNGSGKSTILKLLAGIYSPDKGHILVNGALTPFIELGVGFNPELTGRENVYLNGALLGFNRKEVDAMYDEIVSFSELKRFMDQRLKNYSSGMQVRLAFSIAIRANTPILLLDEVLAVGDSAFQAKCLEYFRTLKKEGKTVVFVTHDMGSVQDFCDRALLLDAGKIRSIGTPTDIASLYLLNTRSSTPVEPSQTHINKQHGIELLGLDLEGGKEAFSNNEKIRFTIHYKLTKKMKHQLGISIMKDGVSLHERNTRTTKLSSEAGKHSVTWEAPAGSLNQGLHTINVAAFTDEKFQLVAYINDANRFMIEKKPGRSGGLIDMHSEWGEVT